MQDGNPDDAEAEDDEATSRPASAPSTAPPSPTRDRIGDFYPDFVHRFGRYLNEAGLSISELEVRTGLSRPTLSRISRGEGNPAICNLTRIASELGVGVAELLGPASAGAGSPEGVPDRLAPLLASAPRGDERAVRIYARLCRGDPIEEVRQDVLRTHYPLVGETPDQAITRSVLDVYGFGRAWVAASRLGRDRELERAIRDAYGLPHRPELAPGSGESDPESDDENREVPVRVLELDEDLHYLIRIHAVAAVAAELFQELLSVYRVGGLSDGFLISALGKWLHRGTLAKVNLVPLVYTPGYAQLAMSGPAQVAVLAQAHHGYRVSCRVEVGELASLLERVEIAVTSCGPMRRENHGRIARLLQETRSKDPHEFVREMAEAGAVGDVMYHFLRADRTEVETPLINRALEQAEPADLLHPAEETPGSERPVIFTASLGCLSRVARRGVSMLLAHSLDRAEVAHAALTLSQPSRSFNFVVTTKATAARMLELHREETGVA